MKDNKDILDDLIGRLQKEDLPTIDNEDDFIDSIMNSLDSDDATPVIKMETKAEKKGRGWVIVLRTVSSIAAALILGLFLMQSAETMDLSVGSKKQYNTETYIQKLPCADRNSTPRDLYMCYTKQMQERAERQDFINQFKK